MICGRGNVGGRDEAEAAATRSIETQDIDKIAGRVAGEFRLYCAREGIELPPHAEVRLKSIWAISIANHSEPRIIQMADRIAKMTAEQKRLIDIWMEAADLLGLSSEAIYPDSLIPALKASLAKATQVRDLFVELDLMKRFGTPMR